MPTPAPDRRQPVDEDARRLARDLMRTARHGALAVIDPETGDPSCSRIGIATDITGAPVFLTSRLASHTPALEASPRASILLGVPGKGDPLAHPRITLTGAAGKVEEEETRGQLRARYLARHPRAALYVDFPDFAFWRLAIDRAGLNAGFGRAYALAPSDILSDGPALAEFAAREAGAVQHMNEDHADAVALYATVLCQASPGDWRLTGIDPDGIDLMNGDETRRLPFAQPLTSFDEVRPALVALARRARTLPDQRTA